MNVSFHELWRLWSVYGIVLKWWVTLLVLCPLVSEIKDHTLSTRKTVRQLYKTVRKIQDNYQTIRPLQDRPWDNYTRPQTTWQSSVGDRKGREGRKEGASVCVCVRVPPDTMRGYKWRRRCHFFCEGLRALRKTLSTKVANVRADEGPQNLLYSILVCLTPL